MASHSYTSSPQAEGKGFPCSNTRHPLLFTQQTGYLFLKTRFLLFCVAAHLHQLRELRAHGLECILCRLWLLLHEVTEEPKAEIRGVGREVSTWVGKASCLTGLDPRAILDGPYPMLPHSSVKDTEKGHDGLMVHTMFISSFIFHKHFSAILPS